MNKPNKSASRTVATTSIEDSNSITSALAVHNKAVSQLRTDLDRVFTACSPLDNKRVHDYLENAAGSDRMLLDAWARCGRNDHNRTVDIRLNEQARHTMTPLGLACLVAYARAWLDEAEAREAYLTSQVSSILHAPSGGSPRTRVAQARRRRARPTGKRSRK